MAQKSFKEVKSKRPAKKAVSKIIGGGGGKEPFKDLKDDRDKRKQEKDNGDKYDRDKQEHDKREREKQEKDHNDKYDRDAKNERDKNERDKNDRDKNDRDRNGDNRRKFAVSSGDVALHERITALEATVAHLMKLAPSQSRHFIPPRLRPDLSVSALGQEPDAKKRSRKRRKSRRRKK